MMGIDPGLGGAIAHISRGESPILRIWDMPVTEDSGEKQIDHLELSNIFAEGELYDGMAFVEQVHAAPGQGVSSTFKFGRSFGVALGVAAAYGNMITLVHPSKWKPKLRVSAGKSKAQKNANAIKRASALFPNSTGAWTRKKDADRAEAALIALYGLASEGPVYPVRSTFINGESV